jgi:hypothetical protein
VAKAAFDAIGSQALQFLRSERTLINLSGEVNGWTGSVSSIDASISTSGTRPVYVTDPIGNGSGPACRIDAGDRGLITTYDFPSAWTAWAIVSVTGTHTDYRNFFTDEASDRINPFYLNINSSAGRFFDGSNDWDLQFTLAANTITRVVLIKPTTTSFECWVNGSQTRAIASGVSTVQPVNICMGSSNGVGGDSNRYPCVNGSIYAWGVISKAVNATERAALFAAMAGEIKGLLLTAAHRSVTTTGQSASLKRARLLSASHRALSLTPQDADLIYTPGGGGAFTLTAEHAELVIAEQAAILKHGRLVTANHAAVGVSPQAANLARGRRVAAGAASVSTTGQSATLRRTRILGAQHRAATLSGQAALLSHGRRLAALHRTVATSPQAAFLRHARRLAAQNATVTTAGQDAVLRRGRRLAAGHRTVALSGQAAGLRHARRLVAQHRALELAEQEATLTHGTGRTLTAEMRAVTCSGQLVTFRRGRRIVAVRRSVAFTCFPARLIWSGSTGGTGISVRHVDPPASIAVTSPPGPIVRVASRRRASIRVRNRG